MGSQNSPEAETEESPQRFFPSWIDQFITVTKPVNAPSIFLKWAAIASVSLALHRRVFLTIEGRTLYPNMYILLVGEPATRKSASIDQARSALRGLDGSAVSPAKITKERFLQFLSEVSVRRMFGTSLGALISELSTFITPNDRDFMIQLTDLYDCPLYFDYETLQRKTKIEYPYITLLGGITPKGISENIGKAILGTGFLSRICMVCTNERRPMDLYASEVEIDYGDFRRDLKSITRLRGQVGFAKGVRRVVHDWIAEGMPPKPTDPKLSEYCGRRDLHLMKLCIVRSASQGDSLEISMADFEWARATLLEAEETMHIALQQMGFTAQGEALTNILKWVQAEFERTGGSGVSDHMLRKRIMTEASVPNTTGFLNDLISSGFCKAEMKPGGGRIFFPGEKRKN